MSSIIKDHTVLFKYSLNETIGKYMVFSTYVDRTTIAALNNFKFTKMGNIYVLILDQEELDKLIEFVDKYEDSESIYQFGFEIDPGNSNKYFLSYMPNGKYIGELDFTVEYKNNEQIINYSYDDLGLLHLYQTIENQIHDCKEDDLLVWYGEF